MARKAEAMRTDFVLSTGAVLPGPGRRRAARLARLQLAASAIAMGRCPGALLPLACLTASQWAATLGCAGWRILCSSLASRASLGSPLESLSPSCRRQLLPQRPAEPRGPSLRCLLHLHLPPAQPAGTALPARWHTACLACCLAGALGSLAPAQGRTDRRQTSCAGGRWLALPARRPAAVLLTPACRGAPPFPSLQVPWHAALGNHDHGETADPSSPACGAWDPACFYSPLNEASAPLPGAGGSCVQQSPGAAAQLLPLPGSCRCGGLCGCLWPSSKHLVFPLPLSPAMPPHAPAARCPAHPPLQLDARLAQRDARWHCERSFVLSLAGGAVDVFFLDTTPLLLEYAAVPWRANRGGLEEQSWEGQLRELEARLARSAAGWKLVVGHHPIRCAVFQGLGRAAA